MGKAIEHLNPEFTIRNATVFMSTAELTGVSVRAIGQKVSSLKDRRHEILLLGLPVFSGRKKWVCHECGAGW